MVSVLGSGFLSLHTYRRTHIHADKKTYRPTRMRTGAPLTLTFKRSKCYRWHLYTHRYTYETGIIALSLMSLPQPPSPRPKITHTYKTHKHLCTHPLTSTTTTTLVTYIFLAAYNHTKFALYASAPTNWFFFTSVWVSFWVNRRCMRLTGVVEFCVWVCICIQVFVSVWYDSWRDITWSHWCAAKSFLAVSVAFASSLRN